LPFFFSFCGLWLATRQSETAAAMTATSTGNAASLAPKFQVSLPAVADGAPVLGNAVGMVTNLPGGQQVVLAPGDALGINQPNAPQGTILNLQSLPGCRSASRRRCKTEPRLRQHDRQEGRIWMYAS
jgi:hypothetical protein